MLLHRLQTRPQLGIRLQQPPDQILTVSARDTVVHFAVVIVADPRVSFLKRGRVERRLSYQQGIQYAAQRPNIRLVAVRLLVQHFRRDVVRRAAYRPANANDRLYATTLACVYTIVCIRAPEKGCRLYVFLPARIKLKDSYDKKGLRGVRVFIAILH